MPAPRPVVPDVDAGADGWVDPAGRGADAGAPWTVVVDPLGRALAGAVCAGCDGVCARTVAATASALAKTTRASARGRAVRRARGVTLTSPGRTQSDIQFS